MSNGPPSGPERTTRDAGTAFAQTRHGRVGQEGLDESLGRRARERELAAAVQSAHDAIYVRDANDAIRTWNPAATALYGYSADEALGLSFVELVPEDRRSELAEWEARVRAGHSVGPVDTRRRRKDGTFVDIALTLSPYRDPTGEVRGIVAVARDIDDRIRDEMERRRLATELETRVRQLASVDARKDEFLAMLSHELRNPLAPIFSAVALLRRPELDEARRVELLDMIERQGRQLARLVDDLLDVSRITQGKIRLRRESVDLRRIVDEALETHRPHLERLEQEIETSLPPEPVWVHGDPVRLRQVVGNLVHNASKFSPPGSRITVDLERRDDRALVEVTDEGCGFEPGFLDEAFELFTQSDRSLARSEGGLGVGLTTVKHLVEIHGGVVEGESEGIDRGSRFRVLLPLTAAGPTPELEVDGPIGSATPLEILIVEDNRDAAGALSELLELSGHRCRIARDGREALESFSAHPTDALLLDLGLPVLDGFAVAEAIRATEAGRRALLIAVSGYGDESTVRRALEEGFDHHLLKPVRLEAIERLLATLRQPLSQPG